MFNKNYIRKTASILLIFSLIFSNINMNKIYATEIEIEEEQILETQNEEVISSEIENNSEESQIE